MDSDQPVHAVAAEAVRVSLCLRDEEATVSGGNRSGGSLTELPRDLHVNSVQQNVQQQGRTTASMRDRRQRLRAAKVVRPSCAPVVRIQRITRRIGLGCLPTWGKTPG